MGGSLVDSPEELAALQLCSQFMETSILLGKSRSLISETFLFFFRIAFGFGFRYYNVTINIGQPPRPYYLDLDTGSDLTWLQCDAPCVRCLEVL